MKIYTHLWWYLTEFFFELEMFQTKFVKKIKKHILCSITFSRNCAVYETMCRNMAEPKRTQMAIWHTCFASWITKATDTHTEYVILIAYSWEQWVCECTSMLQYMKTPVLFHVVKSICPYIEQMWQFLSKVLDT
jgi:hypothetical protein